jgi:PBP1b-binding outer membrane lipoprotein LpoB
MKFLATIFIIIFILTSCGKKSDPKYQVKLNQIKIII